MKETDHAPKSWVRCSLADIVVLNPKNDANAEQTAGFVPMALAPTDYHGALQHEEKLWGDIKKSYTNFADGDVIFAKVTPCFENGKAAIVRDMPSGIGAGSSEFYVLRPASKEISPNLLFAIIKTQSFMQQGAENMTGHPAGPGGKHQSPPRTHPANPQTLPSVRAGCGGEWAVDGGVERKPWLRELGSRTGKNRQSRLMPQRVADNDSC